jgi:hypothetical protein
MTICYIFASRSRPDKFFAGLDNICQLSASQDYFVIAKLDEDDTAMNIPPVWERLQSYPEVTVKWGHSKSKIHAINRSLEDIPPFDILINFSDDMRFTVQGFDDIIREDMKKFFPDGDGVLSYPDGYAPPDLCTMSIMGKKYFDRFGYVYHPAYNSLWCDNEFSQIAIDSGKYQYINNHILEHMHYAPGKTNKDALYCRNDTYHADKQVYEARKLKNFDL